MQEQRTTAPGEDDVDEAANLVDVLFGLVTERRQLSYDERQELRLRVSDRLREIIPYVEAETQEKHLDAHIDRMARSGLKQADGAQLPARAAADICCAHAGSTST